ncbi:pentapeptide repeat-containing protein [Streptomyces sp. NPDC029216]|uniref:pentapeptide repeat-containing protein n=1 Tax=Streptomyces sp. NPDC029216 TaxID=3154701 RepID=UPI0033D1C08C
MIERLLAAFAEGAEDGAAPRTAVGAEEIADILWLAARVDPAAADARTQPPAADGTEPETASPPPAPEPGPPHAPGAGAGAGAAQLFPATTRADPSAGHGEGENGRRGIPLRLPRTASLDDPLGLMRSLRPVGRRSIGGPGEELDEQLTVERSIEAMVPTPVLRPAESRWLDLALVVDAHHSMLLWSDLVAELRGVLTRSGVFRDVRTWQLTGTGRGGTPQLARGPGGPPRNPLELADPAGRRLILVVSDTVAGGWQEGPLRAVLRHWSAHNAVAVLNVLPERLWTRGAVRPVPFAVRSDRPAAATRSWQRVPAARRARGGGPVVPVVGLASGSLARLVRVVSGDGRWRRLACLRLDAAPGPPRGGSAPPRRAADPLELVERFRAGASPTAQQLAAHLAAVPLTLPVMTLVRRSLLRGSEHGHLAEVALGGLFAPWEGQQRLEEAEFDFLPGVREVLLGSQLRGDVAAVRELVRRRVWEFMSRNRGTGPDFSATRVTTGTEGRRQVPEGAQPFAERGPGEPGPADRVVRVRFELLPEAGEVGTLLAPRLVLTAAEVPRPVETVAWVRAGGREVACRAVWWDDAVPRVLLLESQEDLVDPVGFVPPEWAALPFGSGRRAQVDGLTDTGERITLTAEPARGRGALNGELLAPSPEPERWMQFAGGPVLLDGGLVGVVHTVLRDRIVFLTGEALIGEDTFRTALRAHPQAAGALARAWGGSPGPRLAVELRAGEAGAPYGAWTAAEMRETVTRWLEAGGVPGPATVTEDGRSAAVPLALPGGMGRAGRLLADLPTALDGYRARRSVHPPLVVALGFEGGESPLGHPRIAAWLADVRNRGILCFALSGALYEALAARVGPMALAAFEPLGGTDAGWVCEDDSRPLARALTLAGNDAGELLTGWPRCGARAPGDPLRGCAGIRPPGRHACLAHLPAEEQEAVLGALGPGSPLDLRGVPFERELLGRVLDAVREPGTGIVRLGDAAFTGARFEHGWEETEAVFAGEADFSGATFVGPARFSGAVFVGEASFERTVFLDVAMFVGISFEGKAVFRGAVFAQMAHFTRSTWMGSVTFELAVMEGEMVLNGVTVEGVAEFGRVRCEGPATLDGATFAEPVRFEHAVWAGPLTVTGARFAAPASFDRAVCQGDAVFRESRFDRLADFTSVTFGRKAEFDTVVFEAPALFTGAAFEGQAVFTGSICAGGVTCERAVFSGPLTWRDMRVENAASAFGGARFHGPVHFLRADFATDTVFDVATFDGTVSIADCTFRAGLTFEGAAFHARAEFTGVTLAGDLDLPGDWSVTRADGLWNIASPHPAGA